MTNAVITFENFTFRYQNLAQASLHNINLAIFAGEKILITGRSGSGKSTLLHAINGIIPFAEYGEISGTLNIAGVNPANKEIFAISQHVGTILQDQDSQFIGLSVGEDVAFSLENSCYQHDNMHKVVRESLAKVNMSDYIEHSPYELSGGQKQCVSLAGVLASSPEILLFDEPLANLDPKSVSNITALISQLNRDTQKTIIIAEHRIEECLEIGIDRIIVMDNGRIIQIGTPHEILADNTFAKLGIRQPFYIEALKLANVTPANPINHYQDLANLSSQNIEHLRQWAISLPVANIPTKQAQTDKKVLELKNISFNYPDQEPAVNDISLTLNAGEVISILGNNGAGKSTLTQIIAGINRHSHGDILLNNMIINQQSIKERGQNIAIIMQNPNHMIVKNVVWDEVALGLVNLGLAKAEIDTRVGEVLRTCGLWGYRNWPISALSYGQKKRVTIAAMLALKPQILILDEPTAGQDLKTYHEFMEFIYSLAAQGLAIIIITHDLYLALEYTSRSLIMHDGKILADDSPHKLFMNTELLAQANLVEISLSKLAKMLAIDPDEFIHNYISHKKQIGSN